MVTRDEANRVAFERLTRAEPVLVDVQKAIDVVPGMRRNMILTGGPPMPWSDYDGNPRMAVLYSAVHEGLADSAEQAEERIVSGEIVLGSAHAHGCAATNFAICTASMPVLVVEDRVTGRRGFSNIFEGDSPRRLGTGCYGEDVIERMRFVEQVLAPTLGDAVRRGGGLPLLPILRQGFRFGDDMHIRTSASTLHFVKALNALFRELGVEGDRDVQRTAAFVEGETYSFFRVLLAAAKAITDSAGGVEGSSIVTQMSMSARNFAIRVSGLGDEWFFGPHPRFEGRLRRGSGDKDRVVERFHDDHGPDDAGEWITPDQPLPQDCEYPGTDCMLTECLGLGAFAAAACAALQPWHGVPLETIVERNRLMYDITWGEHPDCKIRRIESRGSPVGIDLFKVLERRVTPMLNGILITKHGAIFGTGVLWTPIECFEQAAHAYRARYGGD